MNIHDFLHGFTHKKQTPIQAGDQCRNKNTGVYSTCLSLSQGLYFGRTKTYTIDMGEIKNYEKI